MVEKIIKKSRKVTEGPMKNKERTKSKIMKAVGKVFIQKGFNGLTITNIAKTASIDRKLIYLYYSSVDKLIEEYIYKMDFWNVSNNYFISEIFQKNTSITKNDLYTILSNQFQTILTDKGFQNIIIGEISRKSKVLRKVSNDREKMGESLFALLNSKKNKTTDMRAIIAILISAIYYISLHGLYNGSKFCGIDIKTSIGKARIDNAIKSILDHFFIEK
ncbi:MAG: TetR/AcrR family transcriptional regulator [Bacteroidia bacterium]